MTNWFYAMHITSDFFFFSRHLNSTGFFFLLPFSLFCNKFVLKLFILVNTIIFQTFFLLGKIRFRGSGEKRKGEESLAGWRNGHKKSVHLKGRRRGGGRCPPQKLLPPQDHHYSCSIIPPPPPRWKNHQSPLPPRRDEWCCWMDFKCACLNFLYFTDNSIHEISTNLQDTSFPPLHGSRYSTPTYRQCRTWNN